MHKIYPISNTHNTIHNAQYTIHHKIHNTQCTIHNTQYDVHNTTHYTLRSITIHNTQYTIHNTQGAYKENPAVYSAPLPELRTSPQHPISAILFTTTGAGEKEDEK